MVEGLYWANLKYTNHKRRNHFEKDNHHCHTMKIIVGAICQFMNFQRERADSRQILGLSNSLVFDEPY